MASALNRSLGQFGMSGRNDLNSDNRLVDIVCAQLAYFIARKIRHEFIIKNPKNATH